MDYGYLQIIFKVVRDREFLFLSKYLSLIVLFLMHSFFFILCMYVFIYLFLAALGPCCCTWAFSSCGEWGLLFDVVCSLPIAVASPVAEHGL